MKLIVLIYLMYPGCDTRQGREGACLLQCGHVHQTVGLPDVRVHQDHARPRPQREQRRLPPHRGLHPLQQQGQDNQDVGGPDWVLCEDIHWSQVHTQGY